MNTNTKTTQIEETTKIEEIRNKLDILYYITNKDIKFCDILKHNNVFDNYEFSGIDKTILEKHNNSCDICMDLVDNENKYFYCNKCEHLICHECLVNMITINSENILSCYCTIDNNSNICGYNFSVTELYKICTKDEINQIFNKSLENYNKNNYENLLNSIKVLENKYISDNNIKCESKNNNSIILENFENKIMTKDKTIDIEKFKNYNKNFLIFKFIFALNNAARVASMGYFNSVGIFIKRETELFDSIYNKDKSKEKKIFKSVFQYIGITEDVYTGYKDKHNKFLLNSFINIDGDWMIPLINVKTDGENPVRHNLILEDNKKSINYKDYIKVIYNDLYHTYITNTIDKIFYLKDYSIENKLADYSEDLINKVNSDINKFFDIFYEMHDVVKELQKNRPVFYSNSDKEKKEIYRTKIFKTIMDFVIKIKEVYHFEEILKVIPYYLSNITKKEFIEDFYYISIFGRINNNDEHFQENIDSCLLEFYMNFIFNCKNLSVNKNKNVSVCSCKGITKSTYNESGEEIVKCDLCDKLYCKDCNEVILENHICDNDTKETWQEILKSTTPCPSCCTRINRESGCNVMFCTICHVSFDYETGKKLSLNLHNPHRIEWLKSINDKSLKNGPGFNENVNGVCIDIRNYDFNNLDNTGFKNTIINYQAYLNEFSDKINNINNNFIALLNLEILYKNKNNNYSYNFESMSEYYKFLELNSIFTTFIASLTDYLQYISQLNNTTDLPEISKTVEAINILPDMFKEEINKTIINLHISSNLYNNITDSQYLEKNKKNTNVVIEENENTDEEESDNTDNSDNTDSYIDNTEESENTDDNDNAYDDEEESENTEDNNDSEEDNNDSEEDNNDSEEDNNDSEEDN